jgi:hypothetical protein
MVLVMGDDSIPWFASLWWKDICSIGTNLNQNWFSQSAFKKLGNGINTSFWLDTWVGMLPLQARFPRLFSISNQKNVSVADSHSQSLGTDRWRLVWRRRLFEWEKILVADLLEVINAVSLSPNIDDSWGWKPERGADFTVKSTYKTVALLIDPDVALLPWHAVIFKAIWKCPAPSKVSGFVWKLLHGRLLTRNNLASRSILAGNGDLSCALCGEVVETELHLFLYCEIAMLVGLVGSFQLVGNSF